MNSYLLPLFICYRSSGERLIQNQANLSCVIMSVILMTTLFYEAFILQGEMWCLSLSLSTQPKAMFTLDARAFVPGYCVHTVGTWDVTVYMHTVKTCITRTVAKVPKFISPIYFKWNLYLADTSIKRTGTPKKYLKWSFLLLPTSIKRTLVIKYFLHPTCQTPEMRKIATHNFFLFLH